MAYNWAACQYGLAGTSLQLGSDIVKIGATQLEYASKNVEAAASISQSIANQATYKSQAKSFRTSAEDAVKDAGRAQEQGQQAREQRLVQLGQDKGRIVSSAAGSGIDVSSRVVDKVISDTVKSAYNDTQVIAENEKQVAQSKMNEALTFSINAIRADANAEIESINQDLMHGQMKLNLRASRHAMIGGILSAGANLGLGIASSIKLGASGNNA
jgi:hypothetical protein